MNGLMEAMPGVLCVLGLYAVVAIVALGVRRMKYGSNEDETTNLWGE